MIAFFSDVSATATIDFESAIRRVLNSHWYVLGKEVGEFESAFATYVGVAHCTSVANGTDALEIALRGLGVTRSDTVITVANAGFYTSTAIHAIGAIPIYVDVNETSLTMCPQELEKALMLKPKCVVVTHLYGRLADMDSIQSMCRAAKVPLIEDCAQAHGARRAGRIAGSWGDAACFSFYPTKNLGAFGDGGAVVTNNASVDARFRTLRQYGWTAKYEVTVQGGRNSRLDEMQAAILNLKLPILDEWNAERRRIADRYNNAFKTLSRLTLPHVDEEFVAHLYVLRTDGRDAFRTFLKSKGVPTDVHYPIPDHQQKAYSSARVSGTLRVSEAASARVVSLPCYPGMPEVDIDQVIRAVAEYFRS